jgi:hypothetical protein
VTRNTKGDNHGKLTSNLREPHTLASALPLLRGAGDGYQPDLVDYSLLPISWLDSMLVGSLFHRLDRDDVSGKDQLPEGTRQGDSARRTTPLPTTIDR